MNKTVLLIGLTIILFFNIGCEDKKDKESSPISLIGTWEYHFKSEGDWNYLGWTSEFKSDGTYIEDKKNKTNIWSYNLCESEKVLKIFNSSNPSTENCDCETNSYNYNIKYEGTDTVLLNYCAGTQGLKLIKKT